jgi:predicted phosphodiesterase
MMRYALLSDVHANLPALEAVLTDLESQSVDVLCCLGDAVGYGPDALEVLSLLKAHVSSLPCSGDGVQATRPVWIMGNHDWGLFETKLEDFNHDAQTALKHTLLSLGDEDREFLRGLPKQILLESDGLTMGFAHASGSEPIGVDSRINNEVTAEKEYPLLAGQVNFVGHTHIPQLFYKSDRHIGRIRYWKSNHILIKPDELESSFQLPQGCPAIFNPGSVGQPRDGDTRASYGIFDSESYSFSVRRIPYDRTGVQERLIKWLGDELPNLVEDRGLAGRLALGW